MFLGGGERWWRDKVPVLILGKLHFLWLCLSGDLSISSRSLLPAMEWILAPRTTLWLQGQKQQDSGGPLVGNSGGPCAQVWRASHEEHLKESRRPDPAGPHLRRPPQDTTASQERGGATLTSPHKLTMRKHWAHWLRGHPAKLTSGGFSQAKMKYFLTHSTIDL